MARGPPRGVGGGCRLWFKVLESGPQPMRVFKTRGFAKFAKSEGIGDVRLVAAINGAERGLIDADLGGGLIKLRVARQGKGKSGGYRTLIAYRKGERAVFLFGFAKSDLDNLRPDLVAGLKVTARELLTSSQADISDRLAAHTIIEVAYGKEN